MIKSFFLKGINQKFEKTIKKMHKYKDLSEKYRANKFLYYYFKLKCVILNRKLYYKYSCDITLESKIGNVSFRHPIGIVIGGGAIINNGVIIHQNVTLGALRFDLTERRGVMCNQIIGENTIICAGAKILGDVKIGKNCIIGANAVVTKDIPDGVTVVGYNKVIIKGDKDV